MSDQMLTNCLSVGLSKTGKRKRDPTFTNNEKRNLINLVEKHFGVIECKKTDALSSKAKNNEWLLIAKEFNSITDHIPRDNTTLKTLWDNLKKKAKQTMTVINNNRYATGGGPYTQPKEDPNIDKVISLIKTNVEGFTNIYDCDATLLGNTEDCGEQVPSPPNLVVDFDNHSNEHTYFFAPQSQKESTVEVPINGDWTTYTPDHLRNPRAKVLNVNYDYVVEEIEEFEEIEVVTAPESATCAAIKETPDKNCGSSPPALTPKMTCKMPKQGNKTPSCTSSRHMTNRRRPVLRESEAVALAKKKIETLSSSVHQAQEQHEIVMRCLLLQEEQEKEKLRQEQEKLRQEQEKTEQEKIKKQILMRELEKMMNK